MNECLFFPTAFAAVRIYERQIKILSAVQIQNLIMSISWGNIVTDIKDWWGWGLNVRKSCLAFFVSNAYNRPLMDGLSKLLRGTLDNHPNYFLPVELHKKLKVKKSILIGRESDGRIYFHKAKMGREGRSLKLTWKITRRAAFRLSLWDHP